MSLWNAALAPGLADLQENSVRGICLSLCLLFGNSEGTDVSKVIKVVSGTE